MTPISPAIRWTAGTLAVVSALVVHLAGALDRVGLQLVLAAAGPAW
ncbi:hypothetical protein ACWDOR_16035 [Streptosporangium canum]